MGAHADILAFVKDQLATDPKDSKKFIAMQLGVIATLLVALCAGVLFFYGPITAAPFVAQVAQITITAVGGLVATYIGGQAAVEFKANAVLNTSAGQPQYQEPVYEGRVVTPQPYEPKPFSASATEP